MFSRLGYSPASSYGSISPGSPSSPSSANHDHDRGSTSDTSPTARDNGKRRPQKASSSRVVSCDACIKAKRACNLQEPCSSCWTREVSCTYTAVNPQARLGRLLAIEAADVERTIALRNLRSESDKLLLRIDELKTRLGLSDHELERLQQLANEKMLVDKPYDDMRRFSSKSGRLAAAAPSARGGGPLGRSPPRSLQPNSGSAPAAPTAASTSPSAQGAALSHRPHKRARSDDGASSVDEDGLERDAAASGDEMPPPRTAPTRRQPLRASTRRASLAHSTAAPAPASAAPIANPPPLPPFDPSGRPYPAAAYHFPRSYPMPPQAPMPAPPAWMSPLLPTLYPVLPVPHGHRSWDAPRLELRPLSLSVPGPPTTGRALGLELGPAAQGGEGDAWWRRVGGQWAGPALGGSR